MSVDVWCKIGKVIHVSLLPLNQSSCVHDEPAVQVIEPVGHEDDVPYTSNKSDPVLRLAAALHQANMGAHRLRGVFEAGRGRQASFEAQRITSDPDASPYGN